MELELGDAVLCTVDRIAGTVVFVKIEGNGEGSLILSEIAPGRIRNLRDYVVPKKKIVCKILRINEKGNIELTLRRVTQKEKKEVMDIYDKERKYISLLKSVAGKNADKIVEDIQKKSGITDFFENAKINPEELEKLIGKKDSENILKILNLEKEKKASIKKEISLKSKEPDGIIFIKKVLEEVKDVETTYISAGRYSIKIESNNLKKADQELRGKIEQIKENAKKHKIEFTLCEK